jgi:hypothetical protein
MFYCTDIHAETVREKMRLLMLALIENIGDNDEALDIRDREMDKLEYQDGFEFVVPAYLNYYWSSGTGTPMHDKLIQRLLDSQAEEWARQYPDRLGLAETMMADEDLPYRDDAEEWENAALTDEVIYLRIEMIRADGDIKFTACFMNEINIPFGDEYEVEIDESAFLTLEGEELEAFANKIAAAPYEATI